MEDKVKKLEKELKAAKQVLKGASVFMKSRAKKKVEQLEKKLVEAKILLANKGKPLTSAQEEYVKTVGKTPGNTPSGQMKRGAEKPSKKAPKLPPTKNIKDVRGDKTVTTPPKKATQAQKDYINRQIQIDQEKSEKPANKPTAKNSVTTTGGRPVTTTGGRPVTLKKPAAAKKSTAAAKKSTAAAKKSTAAAKKKAPGKFSEEAGKAFFKKLGIDAKYDDDDMPKRSSPERAKGGMVAKKKPVVAKKYGGMAVKKKAGGTVKKMCGGMAHRSKKGKK
jgi:hypothetical protein